MTALEKRTSTSPDELKERLLSRYSSVTDAARKLDGRSYHWLYNRLNRLTELTPEQAHEISTSLGLDHEEPGSFDSSPETSYEAFLSQLKESILKKHKSLTRADRLLGKHKGWLAKRLGAFTKLSAAELLQLRTILGIELPFPPAEQPPTDRLPQRLLAQAAQIDRVIFPNKSDQRPKTVELRTVLHRVQQLLASPQPPCRAIPPGSPQPEQFFEFEKRLENGREQIPHLAREALDWTEEQHQLALTRKRDPAPLLAYAAGLDFLATLLERFTSYKNAALLLITPLDLLPPSAVTSVYLLEHSAANLRRQLHLQPALELSQTAVARASAFSSRDSSLLHRCQLTLGTLLIYLKHYQEATIYLRSILSREGPPTKYQTGAALNLAMLYQRLDQPQQAVKCLERLGKLEGPHLEFKRLWILGYAHRAAGAIADSDQALRMALATQPGKQDAANLYWCLSDLYCLGTISNSELSAYLHSFLQYLPAIEAMSREIADMIRELHDRSQHADDLTSSAERLGAALRHLR